MHYLIICLSAFLASGLTLFSGFGLGTLLLPVMAIFFPIDTAIALTAIVHLLNNLFKLALLGRHADRSIVLHFGLPAILTALLGAQVLLWLSHLQPLLTYQFLGAKFQVMPVKLVVACLMVFFSLFDLLPRFAHISFDKKYMPLGGLLSGFFGGLSGHQGALRSAFLIKSGLSKETFIATGVIITLMVDIPRIAVYSATLPLLQTGGLPLLSATGLAAFSGAFVGNRLLKKVTLRAIQILVASMLLGISLALALGLL
ncbi:MAG: sulfite exporter TauE/SafE family protein [Deltaproteobacteria bacterium]|nr:MAG: sulfite exporter TauE/SafE family protein [Deltaproteobacteria bacterium]